MEWKDLGKEAIIILVAAIILALSVTFLKIDQVFGIFVAFAVLITGNILIKKAIGYYLETDVTTRFWSWYQYGFRKDQHFKKPLPMAWWPLALSLITKGYLWWLAILEFDVKGRTERVSRRHGLYRFSEVTEWHMAIIAIFGIATNLIMAVIGYIAGFETFASLNIYYAFWSTIPLSSLDGNKILFGSKILWFITFIICAIFLGYSFMVI